MNDPPPVPLPPPPPTQNSYYYDEDPSTKRFKAGMLVQSLLVLFEFPS
jgi:hypothetical protein